MKNIRVAFEVYEGSIDNLSPGYQEVNSHIIFDIKKGQNFRKKARIVAGGYQTISLTTLTYSSIVSRDSVRIALILAALNGLQVLACDIQNAYLIASCYEKIWTTTRPEFRSDVGKNILVVWALYGLKSSGAVFRAFLAEIVHDLGYKPFEADLDV